MPLPGADAVDVPVGVGDLKVWLYDTKKRGEIIPAFGFEKPYSLVTQEGLEPPTTSSEDWCSIQLSYWATYR